MNYKDIQPIDSRPKRRKSRDNPYTLFTVGMWEGSPRVLHFFPDNKWRFHLPRDSTRSV